MPSVPSGKILLTAINGFVPMWVAKTLLENGFSVRGTVRSPTKAAYVLDHFKAYGDKLEVLIVEDVTKDGAFDEVVKDVDAIVHAAAAFHLEADDPNELIVPAVQGTTGILTSALKHGNNLKRFIQLSSIGAVQDDFLDAPKLFTEKDWNHRTVQECETKGHAAHPRDKYNASKTLSELAAWDFVEKNKEHIKWDLVALNPAVILGPTLADVQEPIKLNASNKYFFFAVLAGVVDKESLVEQASVWVDVRDVTDAMVSALTKPKVGGERIIISASPFCWQQWINVARTIDPSVPEGNQSFKPEEVVYTVDFNNSKSKDLLGLTYRSWEECGRSVIDGMKAKGWWGKK